VAQPIANPPVPTTPATPVAIAKQVQRQLITILEQDHNYDVVAEIVKHIRELKRAKKIKPLDKHRMVLSYNTILLSYCMPKMRVTEDNSANPQGKGVIFKINIGATNEPPDPRKAGAGKVLKDKKGVSVSIPTQLNKDGSYSIDSDPID
jgi:hypothetical protein